MRLRTRLALGEADVMQELPHDALIPGQSGVNLPDSSAAVNQLPRVGELLLGAGFVVPEAIQTALARQRLENRKLGELIVDLGMLDEADLEAVLAIQSDLRAGRADDLSAVVGSRLGAILLASKCVTKAQLDRALACIDDSEEHLGEILVRQGALSAAQLNGALVFQAQVHARRSDRFKLGRMLVESGDISEQALLRAVARQKVNGKRLGETLLELGAISKPALGAGLTRQRRLIAAAMAAISLIVGAGMSEEVAAATTTLRVSARILTHVSFRSMKVPDQVAITPADISRGFVDLDTPIEMEVRTNSASDIVVGISLNSPAFTGATVSGPTGTTRVIPGTPSIVIASHGQGMHTESLSLRMRLELGGDATPGTILMPVSLLVSPV
jgi:hypothetical protein